MKKQAKDIVVGDFIIFPGRRHADKVIDVRTIATGPLSAARQLTGYDVRWTLPLEEEVTIS